MIKHFCDICNTEITNKSIHKLEIITTKIEPFTNPTTISKGEICTECTTAVKELIFERSKLKCQSQNSTECQLVSLNTLTNALGNVTISKTVE